MDALAGSLRFMGVAGKCTAEQANSLLNFYALLIGIGCCRPEPLYKSLKRTGRDINMVVVYPERTLQLLSERLFKPISEQIFKSIS